MQSLGAGKVSERLAVSMILGAIFCNRMFVLMGVDVLKPWCSGGENQYHGERLFHGECRLPNNAPRVLPIPLMTCVSVANIKRRMHIMFCHHLSV